MGKRVVSFILVLIVLLVIYTVCSAAINSQNYQIPASTFSGGGERLGSAGYILESTMGQPSLMEQNNMPRSGSYYSFPGLWYTVTDFNFSPCILDTDNDSICDDGDFSDVAGDNPCMGGVKFFCDDNCPFICNSNQLDADGDGIGDVCDSTPGCGGCAQDPCEQECVFDSDNDTIPDTGDNCPIVPNIGQEDFDDDGIGDVCDNCTDTDDDNYGNPGYPDNTCPDDNCPDNCNTEQTDADGDGEGDVCDSTPGCGGCAQDPCEDEC